MKKFRESIWLWVALFWIVISVASMFISIVSYRTPEGVRTTYAIQHLIDGDTFSKEVLSHYTARTRLNVGPWALTALCVLGVGAIVAALTGLLLMSKQKSVRWPFVMTLIGAIGTAVPALAILVGTVLSINYFPGRMSPGFYPIITPIAVAICLVIVIRERRRIVKANAAVKNNDLIRPAGDL